MNTIEHVEHGRIGGQRRGALQKAKTHCPRGHAYTEENTYIHPSSGSKMCRICKRASNKRHRQGTRLPARQIIEMHYIGACALLGRLSTKYNTGDLDLIKGALDDLVTLLPGRFEVVSVSRGWSLEPVRTSHETL
jgi:hypothetical protein